MKHLVARILTCIAGFVSLTAFAGNDSKAKLVEKVTRKGDDMVIPYERYVLPNGLTLLIHEDHSDPIAHVDVTYHVGSSREQEGRSGFAHFFEHMMFQGSDHVENGQHFKIISEAGGSLNGSTNSDRTNYFETLPANQLEKALWLEADRMGFLIDAVTQQKFEVQRGTVKNERGQSYDNRPYGLVEERTAEALYPQGHPYSWQTIGYIEDLNRVDVNDLKKFFMRWYGPNNAVVTVAGDVKPETVVSLVEKYFGSIPRGVEVKPMPKQAPVLDKNRYISYEDRIRSPELDISWPGVRDGDPDAIALDALGEILANSKTSIFYKKFILSQTAGRAFLVHDARELSGMVRLSVRAFPGKTLAQIDSIIKAGFAEFEKKGVSEEEVSKFRNSTEVTLLNELSAVRGKASVLAHNYTLLGDANHFPKEAAELKKLKKEDVMRVYEKYIKGKPAVYLSVYPQGHPEVIAAPDNFTPPRHRTDVPESPEYKNLSYHKATDNFDRKVQPLAGPAPEVKVPDFWQQKFPNGLNIIGVKNDELPLVSLTISLEAGHRQETSDNAGISSLCASLMNQGTKKHTADQIEDMLDMLGSSVSFSSSREEITLNVTSLTKNLDATLRIAEEMFTSPGFDSVEFAREKKQALEAIANSATQPNSIADNVYNKLMFGEKNILSVPASGTEESVKSITLDAVKKFYESHFSSNICEVVMVGDVDQQVLLKKLAFLTEWKSKPITLVTQNTDFTPRDKLKIYLVNKEKAAQSVVKMGEMTGLKFDATGEYFKASTMNFPLGGAFNSRINMDLREKKAWTYGASSQFASDKYTGVFTVTAAVRTNSTDSTLMDLVSMLKEYQNVGMSREELEFAQKSMSLSDALRYETPRQKAFFLKRIMDYDLDKNYVKKQTEVLSGLKTDELNALAKKYISPDKMFILVVGDKKVIYPGLQKLGYEVVELDINGNPLKLKQ
jgi:zinc protease